MLHNWSSLFAHRVSGGQYDLRLNHNDCKLLLQDWNQDIIILYHERR